MMMMMMMMIMIIIIIIIIIKIIAPRPGNNGLMFSKGIVSSHGGRDPIWPWLGILLEMVSR